MIEVTQDRMFAEACQALGESIVRERILAAEVERLTAAASVDHPHPRTGGPDAV